MIFRICIYLNRSISRQISTRYLADCSYNIQTVNTQYDIVITFSAKFKKKKTMPFLMQYINLT